MNTIAEAKRVLPLPALLHREDLGEHAKKSARCPFHDDQRNSFSIWQRDGAWYWKCWAGCGKGDEITFLEKHNGITTGEAIKLFLEMAGCAPVNHPPAVRRDNPERTNNTGFDWQACVDALTETDLERLSNERWLSRAFCSWLHKGKFIGLHNGCVAFPNGNGTVVGAHIWQGDKDWLFYPAGNKTQPFVMGDLKNAKQVHLFESQWDMLAFADRTGNYEAQGVAFVATRGASNAALVKDKLPAGASVLAWPQNDAAGEKWLSDLSTFVPRLGVARVPASIKKRTEFGETVKVRLKDLNDWTKAGASAEDIYALFFRNELYKPGPTESAALIASESVNLAALLEEVCSHLKRYVVFAGEAQPVAVALWAAHAWAIDAFDYTPYLHVDSPEKRSGKTKLLDCVELIVRKAWRAISPTEAVLFRKIEADKPTLLLDEVDAIFSGGKDERREPLRALLNAGFERKAKVPRCVGPSFQVQDFDVFCAKAFAGIGRLPDTISDRCISIRLVRKSRDEFVERFRKREAGAIAAPISAALEAWASCKENIAALRASRPNIPDELSDRQADICEPLLSIADLAAGEWPGRSRNALVLLCAAEAEDDSLGVKLLSAIHDAFVNAEVDRLATKELLEHLINQETDAPWAGWWENDLRNGNTRGPAARLAHFLKPYRIKARVIRLPDNTTPRGYLRADFEDAWKRYCPPKSG
jgi:Protein of unknown function (DUF3631)/CHC2 zinc finger